jgi:hypothetical protein
MAWRRLARAVHRDLGYSAAALVLAYALSGLAVNHIEDWNPSYTFDEVALDLGPLPAREPTALVARVRDALELPTDEVRGHFLETETRFRVFLRDGQEVTLELDTGRGVHKRVATRPVLYEVNALHLNTLKGAWTWIADVFAAALIVLALTGAVMLEGKRGLAGRGKWFLAAGCAVPIGFVVYLHAG